MIENSAVTAIVVALINNGSVEDIKQTIKDVRLALEKPVEPEETKPVPAVNPRRSVFPDYIICLEDGRKMKILKRHLRNKYGLTPDEYRAKWGLPKNYPMVCPNYGKVRSKLAKANGLGVRS